MTAYSGRPAYFVRAKERWQTCILRARQLRLYGHVARLPAEDPNHRILSCQDPRGGTIPRKASTRSLLASGGVLSEGYGHGEPGVGLSDCQTGAERVPPQGRRGDALLRLMAPYLN